MTRELPKDDSEGRDYVTFRGPQTSVTVDGIGVRFETEHRGGQVCHKPVPVVDPDADPADVPDDAIARPVAEELVESNPLIDWGVPCEHVDADGDVCGEVFDTPKGEASHRSVHADDTDQQADDGGDGGGE